VSTRSRVGLYAAFAGMGGTAATIPALLPSLEFRLGSVALSAVPALFTGLLLGVLLSAPLLVRLRARTVAALGAGIQAASLIMLILASSGEAVVVVAAAAGVGFGLTEAAGSVAAKRSAAGSATRTLAALTGTVAVSAALSPVLVALAPGGTWLVPALVAALQLTACFALLSIDEEAPARPASPGFPSAAGRRWQAGSVRVSALAAVALVLYVGIETVFSGWSAVIPAAVLGLDSQTAALGTSVFWICMAAGRFLAAALMHRGVRPQVLLVVHTAITASALVSAVAVPSPFGLIGLALAVVAMAPVYSLVLGEALDRLPSHLAARATGPLVAAGALGGTLVPAAVLVSGLQPTSPGTFLLAAAFCLVLCGGAALVLRSSRAPAPPVSHPLRAAQQESPTP
jgi:fucose permease